MPYNVCFISPNAHLGGAEKVLEQILKNRSSLINPIVVFCKNGPLVEKWRKLNISCFILPPFKMRNPFSLLQAQNALEAIVRDNKCNLIFSNMSYAHILGGVTAKKRHLPEVWFQHGPIGGLIERVASKIKTNKIFINSNYLKNQQRQFVSEEVIEVLYCPVQKSDWNDQQRKDFRAQFIKKNNWSAKVAIIAHVARLDPWKGQLEFLNIFHSLSEWNQNLRVVLFGDASIGDNKYYLKLMNYVKKHNLTQKVLFLGFEENLDKIYSVADLLVHTSIKPEPLGLVVLEAQMRKVPVITWSQGGVQELIQNMKTGIIVKTHDQEDLRNTIIKCLEDQELQIKIKEAAFESVQKYESTKWVLELERKIESVIKEYSYIEQG